MPVASPTALASDSEVPGDSSTTSVIPARRASAASRPSRSPNLAPVLRAAGSVRSAGLVGAAGPVASRAGRSMTSRSTARPDRREPAIARLSSGSAGVRTTSHSGRIPRATASTGSRACARSSQATIAPAACASAASRRAIVVRPLDRSPRSATPIPRGTPPGPRMASSSANPVEWTRSGSAAEPGRGASGISSASAGSGTVASAPTTSPANRSPAKPGAAAPQRDRSVASAAVRSEEGAPIGVKYRTDVRMIQALIHARPGPVPSGARGTPC